MKLLKKPIFRLICLFILTRLLLTATGVYARGLANPTALNTDFNFSNNEILNAWGYWDTGWYLDIASNWYTFEHLVVPGAYGQASYSFFPLYPLFVRLLFFLVPNYLLSGIIVSNFFFIGCIILLYKVVKVIYGKTIAEQSTRFMIIFPTSYIFSAMLSESVFLFFLLLTYWCIQNKKWRSVGLSGFLMSVTRVNGLLILLPLAYKYLEKNSFKLQKVKGIEYLWLLGIPVGFLVFGVYVWQHVGDPWAFITIRKAWGSEFSNIILVFYHLIQSNQLYSVWAATITFTILCFSILAMQVLKKDLAILIAVIVFPPILLGSTVDLLLGLPRLILPAFPLYVALALLVRNVFWKRIISAGMLVTLVMLHMFAAMGYKFVI